MEKKLDMVVNDYVDENYNNRIIMINRDGSMDVLADRSGYDSEEFRHMLYFINYFDSHYLNDKQLQSHGHSLNGFNVVMFLLTKLYGVITIVDTSSGKNRTQYGIVQLPDTITEEQKEKFLDLYNVINKYSELLICAQPMLDDNIPRNGVYKHLKNSEFNVVVIEE